MGRNINRSNPRFSTSSCLIVEFVGLPAGGKSTLSRRTSTMLNRDYAQVSEPIYCVRNLSEFHRFLSKGRFAIEHAFRRPRTALSITWSLLKIDQASVTDWGRVNFNLQYVSGIVTQSESTPGVTLLDQGPYQAVWSVGLYSSTDWDLLFDEFDRYLSHIVPDLVVCVDAEPATVADRLANRSGGDTRLSVDSSRFSRAVDGYNQLKNHLEDTHCRTLTVDNDTEEMLEPNVDKIVKEIRTLSAN